MIQAVQEHSGRVLLRHLRLLVRTARSELRSRYAGSVFGIGWAVLTPLLMLSIYAVVYTIVFRVRATGLSTGDYVLYIFSGLLPFLMTGEALGASVGSISASKSVWTNTVFPVDLAPAKAVLLSQVSMAVGFAAVLAALPIVGRMHASLLLLPLVWGLHVLALVGLTWILALVNLVFRDLQNVIGVVLMVLMIASPIAYTPDMVPRKLALVLAFNPFAYYVRSYQYIVVLGRAPAPVDAAVVIVLSLALFFLGGYFFSRAKPVLLDYV